MSLVMAPPNLAIAAMEAPTAPTPSFTMPFSYAFKPENIHFEDMNKDNIPEIIIKGNLFEFHAYRLIYIWQDVNYWINIKENEVHHIFTEKSGGIQFAMQKVEVKYKYSFYNDNNDSFVEIIREEEFWPVKPFWERK